MKKMKRFMSIILCMSMIFCALSVQSFAVDVLRNNTNQKVRLYGDMDGDGVVEQSDYEQILAIATGEAEMPEIGSPEYYAADIMGDGITMEDARRCYRLLQGLDSVATYSPEERELELFNDLVNVLKDYDFFDDRVYYYTYEYEFMETKNLDFGIYTGLIEDALRAEDGASEKYYSLRKSSQKAGYILPGPGANVSELRPQDIQSMNIEVGVPCTFSADIGAPEKYTVGVNEYDLTRFRTQEANYADCIKVTLEIKNESFKNDVPEEIKALAKKQLHPEYEMAEGEKSYLEVHPTALYNMHGTDIIELGASFPLEQADEADGVSTRIYAELIDIKTAGSLVFYFDRATLNPIAASYTVETDIDQNVEMSMGLASFNISGKMSPRNLMISQVNYWFCGYFS